MINAIVIDDEWYNLEEIVDLVNGTGFIHVIKKYQNPIRALQEAKQYKPELAFLDIEMPEIDGINLAEQLYKVCPGIRIVFITSWNQYAVSAFDLNAVDYILKPIKLERFQRMVEKLKSEFKTKHSSYSDKIKINCFQKLEASIGGIPVKWERSKSEELFAYLVMNHDSYIHKDIIIQDLWTDYDPTRALQILQTAVSRIRNIFSQMSEKIILDYSGNKYCLLLKEVACDLVEMEHTFSDFQLDDEKTYEGIEKYLELYKKGFLEQQGYLWSMGKDMELGDNFIRILNEIVKNYSKYNKREEVLKYLKLLSQIAPYDQEVNYQLLKMWKDNGEEYEAKQHYLWLI
ncbi:response regulator [Anaerosacchariphilus polymeriproducens]|uniref:Stage 0 sporulation protein A homolog n=1 Tax=Anaerosacchariphilus polymeriproducens TaxID=1812858 RepID=A0A371AX58_9FIRM|nr:response regulator [Anaerosacchariphilus polymeriproducens]RDU24121.1 response regulator [Anaerosacchariphilus polymeriproducens]